MRGKIFYDDLVDRYEKLAVDADKAPYGFVCSEDTAISLKTYFEDISGQPIQKLATVSGLKMMAIEGYPLADMIFILDKENFTEVEKNGLSSLIRKIAKANNIKLWGLDDYSEIIAKEA